MMRSPPSTHFRFPDNPDASMTDLSIVLPGFPTQAYAKLIPSLEKNLVTTTDLITLDSVEIAKRARLPLQDLKRLCDHVLRALHASIEVGRDDDVTEYVDKDVCLKKTGKELVQAWRTISTLDGDVDAALGGGIPTGYITEVTGESGAGKTQFLLALLLSVQLPSPYGLSQSALYISTESALPTIRLSQMLLSHPLLLASRVKPSLDQVISIVTPDLESQDHILRFQVPVALERHNVGLIIIDSVAANYRAEFERPGANGNGANMATRSSELVKLGAFLRNLARTKNIAVVIANQVGDRFTLLPSHWESNDVPIPRATQSSPLAHRGNTTAMLPPPSSTASHPPPSSVSAAVDLDLTPAIASPMSEEETMSLDHQQRWFTGWGDDHDQSSASFRMLAQKTPSLGLVWTNQIACRIALIKAAVYGRGMEVHDQNEAGEPILKKWRRYMKVVFAPWARPSVGGLLGALEFEIERAGIMACKKELGGEKEPNGNKKRKDKDVGAEKELPGDEERDAGLKSHADTNVEREDEDDKKSSNPTHR